MFQSTLPQGKWLRLRSVLRSNIGFNPHFRKGSDSPRVSSHRDRLVSIHTSAREVTQNDHAKAQYNEFQSTLPQGKWQKSLLDYFGVPVFQSTLPQGKWQRWWSCSVLSWCFNPHFRKGSDEAVAPEPVWAPVSIHTSAREVTQTMFRYQTYHRVSIHTSAREVTTIVIKHLLLQVFQSTLPQGKWLLIDAKREADACFNPHFRKGSDLFCSICFFNLRLFQSTLPQGKWLYEHFCNLHSVLVSIHTSAREVTIRRFYLPSK